MKKLSLALLFAMQAGCSTAQVATDYFYKNVVDEYCTNGEAERSVLRATQNEGRENKVYIVCKDDRLNALNF